MTDYETIGTSDQLIIGAIDNGSFDANARIVMLALRTDDDTDAIFPMSPEYARKVAAILIAAAEDCDADGPLPVMAPISVTGNSHARKLKSRRRTCANN